MKTATMIVSVLFCAILLSLSGAANAEDIHISSPDELTERTLCFTNVTVIDATGASAQIDMSVVVRGETISEIGRSTEVEIPENAQVIDLTGKFLIPGLCDMHTHLTSDTENLKLFVANGVTLVRDMGSLIIQLDSAGELIFPDLELMIDEILSVRDQVNSGEIFGPTIFTPGVILTGPLPDSLEWEFLPWQWALETEDQARAAVVSLINRNVDFIKVHTLPSREVYFAIADQAYLSDISFAGHVPVSITAEEASNAGQRSIEHLTGVWDFVSDEEPNDDLSSIDESKLTHLIQTFVTNDTWHIPTLIVAKGIAESEELYANPSVVPLLRYVKPEIYKWWEDFFPRAASMGDKLYLVGRLNDAGVNIMAGTDLGAPFIIAGFSLHDEMALLNQAGLSTMEVIQAATLNPAIFLGLSDERGTLEPGKLADMVILNENPLEDIENIRSIYGVVLRGRYLPEQELQDLLNEVENSIDQNMIPGV